MTSRLEHDEPEAEAEVEHLAPLDAPDEVPAVEGWEANDRVSRDDVERLLREHLDRSEYAPEHIGTIRYRPEVVFDGRKRVYGTTQAEVDPHSGLARRPDIEVYHHSADDPAGTEEETLMHEVGHTVWRRAPEELRDLWTRQAHEWHQQHRAVDIFATGEEAMVSEPIHPVIPDRDPEEHFCEAFSETVLHPERLDELDADLPEDRRRRDWVEFIRREVRRHKGTDA